MLDSPVINWWQRRRQRQLTAKLVQLRAELPSIKQGNRCGLGGQRAALSRRWTSIHNETHTVQVVEEQVLSRQAVEFLFYTYFAPLEYWCERNLQGDYYLWSDEYQVNLILLNPDDTVAWQLIWGNGLPSLSALDEIQA
jgi:hypothetical protein